jgi:hypothetical protein
MKETPLLKAVKVKVVMGQKLKNKGLLMRKSSIRLWRNKIN